MWAEFLLGTFQRCGGDDAIIWNHLSFTYQWLLDRYHHWHGRLRTDGVTQGSVVALEANFSPNAIALLLALLHEGCILVPLVSGTPRRPGDLDRRLEIARAEFLVQVDSRDDVHTNTLAGGPHHELYEALRRRKHPGLVLFSSGSTGNPKAVVHDACALFEKFKVPRRRLKTFSFLSYDHIGGVNTLLYTLSNGGCLVTARNRTPDGVLELVEKHHVQLLPVSPTFINLLLVTGAHERYDLRSLERVTYGTEPITDSALKRFHHLFPDVTLQQTYGLSELGILRSKSKSSDSLWVKVGGEGVQTRIVDGELEIKTRSVMLGYLNAPCPFTDDGWFKTGDAVAVDGDYIRILGRASEVINVGGEKVHPAEVENVIRDMDNVAEVKIYGRENPIMGHVVSAQVKLTREEDKRTFRLRLRKHCAGKLEPYKVPVHVESGESWPPDSFRAGIDTPHEN